MNRLCLCAEAADSFSGYKCYHMWNLTSEIVICTSDPSVDSITHVILLSKELGCLDLLENGTFWPILEWVNTCFGCLSRLTAWDCIFFWVLVILDLWVHFLLNCVFSWSHCICGQQSFLLWREIYFHTFSQKYLSLQDAFLNFLSPSLSYICICLAEILRHISVGKKTSAIELLLHALHLSNGIIIDFFTPCHFRVTLEKPPERVKDETWQSRESFWPPHRVPSLT